MPEKQPLNLREALSLEDEAENLFASLFFKYYFDKKIDLFHERRRIVSPTTYKKTLPDFEMKAIKPQQFAMTGGFVEVALYSLDKERKDKQRQAVFGWMEANPGYFYLQMTKTVMDHNPSIVHSVIDVFTGKTKAATLQEQILDTQHDLVFTKNLPQKAYAYQ